MGWNGSGIFTRGYSWINDAANSIPITASRMDADTNDIVSNGLNNCLTRDGQGIPTANLPMNGFRHTGASNGVAPTDYATMGQIAGFAPLASPNFTGIPLVPTASPGTNTQQVASTQFVNTALTSYLPLSGGTLSGSFTVNAGSLGTSSGNFLVMGSFNFSDANSDQIIYQATRSSNGTGWTSAYKQIYSKVDNTVHGVIQFSDGAGNANYAMGFGYQVPSLTCTSSNTWGFSSSVSVAGTLNANGSYSYGGITQPHVFVQSSQPTAIATGDLWFW
jgi:hypothetical protein